MGDAFSSDRVELKVFVVNNADEVYSCSFPILAPHFRPATDF